MDYKNATPPPSSKRQISTLPHASVQAMETRLQELARTQEQLVSDQSRLLALALGPLHHFLHRLRVLERLQQMI